MFWPRRPYAPDRIARLITLPAELHKGSIADARRLARGFYLYSWQKDVRICDIHVWPDYQLDGLWTHLLRGSV